MMRFLFLVFPLFLFSNWAEDTLATMTLDEKIGQLFVAPACPLASEEHWVDWQRSMQEYGIGNAILKQSDPASQIAFLDRLQEQAKIPLLVTADAEWGLAMRMSNTIAFPRNMTLGAIEDIDLIYQLGREIGRQARIVGIHMNLAPVADVNNNPANPVIHMRSFGEDPQRVAACVSAFARGLQASGTLACAKHFPGHGDTSVDSHRDLPVIPHGRERLESVEFVPFKQVIDEGIGALMSAHLYVPALDPIYPTSLSPICLKGIARHQLGFKGLLISDALNMKAIADRYSPEQIALLARAAGCDLLLYGDHIAPRINQIMRETIPRAFKALKEAYLTGDLELKDLDESVLRILRAKEQIGLNQTRTAPSGDLHSQEALDLKKRLFQEAVTLIGKPVSLPENTAYLSFGSNDLLAQEFTGDLSSADCVVIAVHQKEALTEEVLATIESLADRAVLCLFTSPYVLKHFHKQKTILLAYENDPDAQQAIYQVLTGRAQAKGRLPIGYL
ncbi:MAG TPA: glycoside hydrolase family 3 N-terminal domain-containing protein [Chlamydiales bacterium]|nr:glycoside hydrolase family 3 N-terminal domain-containing protein [Chlamydiales bacterium]